MSRNVKSLGRLRRDSAPLDGPGYDDEEPGYDYVLGEAAPAKPARLDTDDFAVPSVERDHARYPSHQAEKLAEERRRANIPRLRLVPTALAVACLLVLACVVGVLWHARTQAVVEGARPLAVVGTAPTASAGIVAGGAAGVAAPKTPAAPSATAPAIDAPTTPTTPTTPPTQTTQPRTAPLFVHVTGAVNRPGVVQVPADARAVDALEAAGGPRADADLDAINLAAALSDGQQVHVPTPGEATTQPAAPAAPHQLNPAPGSPTADPTAPLNLNSANLTQLDALPGIGPALAQRILDWRAQNGNFASVDELDEVSGIGPAVLERLRPLVTV